MRWNFGMIFRYHGTTCNYCDCQNVLSIFSDCKNELKGVVVVAQLVEQLFPNNFDFQNCLAMGNKSQRKSSASEC